jgi:hypothetical protein
MKTAVVQPFIYHVNGMNEKFSTISVSYDLKVQMASLSVIVFFSFIIAEPPLRQRQHSRAWQQSRDVCAK